MEMEIQKYFFMFEELPNHPQEVVWPNGEIRGPWVMNGMVDFGFTRPSKMEGWLAFEHKVFQQTIPICQAKIPDWERELAVARQPLLERDGDLSAQLDMFLERTFHPSTGYFLLVKLQDEQGVSEEALIDFVDAYSEVREINDFRQWAGQVADSPDLAAAVDAKASQELALALREYRRAKSVVLEQAPATVTHSENARVDTTHASPSTHGVCEDIQDAK